VNINNVKSRTNVQSITEASRKEHKTIQLEADVNNDYFIKTKYMYVYRVST